MAKYTLKTFCGEKLIERFENRDKKKMLSILEHDRHHHPHETDAWGESLGTADRFEIFDAFNEKMFDGSIFEVEEFISRKLK